MPSVAILMATYNGEKFLLPQLDSLLAQTHKDWTLHVSDDGSSDRTRGVIDLFAREHTEHKVTLVDGPGKGHAQNFLSLLRNTISDAEYFAFSDQDDIWEPNKLARAVAWLTTTPSGTPALYGARTLYVSEDNKPLSPSTLFKKQPSFANALVQCFAGANTMVMNRAARDLLASLTVDVPAHDWWTYLAISGVGGAVHYDPEPCLRYRQHPHNLMGQNVSSAAKLARIRGLWDGTFREWNNRNVAALESIRPKLTPEAASALSLFTDARNSPLALRLAGFYSSGIHRQTLLGNLGLVAAAITNKV